MKDHPPTQGVDSGVTCREIADRASDYLEERLPIFTRAKIELHLASCSGCHDYVGQISLVKDSLPRLPQQLPSPIKRLRLRELFVASHSH